MKLQGVEYIIIFLGIELQMSLHQDTYPWLYEWLEQSSSERKPLPFLQYCIEKSWIIIQIYLVWYTLSGLSRRISFVNQCLVSKAKSMINSYKSFNFISVNTFLYLAWILETEGKVHSSLIFISFRLSKIPVKDIVNTEASGNFRNDL